MKAQPVSGPAREIRGGQRAESIARAGLHHIEEPQGVTRIIENCVVSVSGTLPLVPITMLFIGGQGAGIAAGAARVTVKTAAHNIVCEFSRARGNESSTRFVRVS